MEIQYIQSVKQLTPRALSMLDWEQTSISQGSFDRTWWCWKFTDFSAPRLQEGVFLLSWLATEPNSFYPNSKREKLIEMSMSAINFWSTLQHGDGSFDEAYPNERSLAATAFSTFYVGSALEYLKGYISQQQYSKFLKCLDLSGSWLAKNGEYHGILSNHLAAAAAALQVVGDVCQTNKFTRDRDRYLQIIYQKQHPTEGWLEEYGGADPGYQSHAMFYLADIERRTNNAEIFNCLKKASDFIEWFAHPDGSLGGEYASRGTKFCFPAAFEMLSSRVASSKALSIYCRKMLAKQNLIGANEVDRFNFFPLLNNLLFANKAANPIKEDVKLAWENPGSRAVFDGAGIAVLNCDGKKIVLGGGSGGVVKIWSPAGELSYEDCGYYYRLGPRYFSSQGKSEVNILEHKSEICISVSSQFIEEKNLKFGPFRFIIFRLINVTIGRNLLISRFIKKLLVYVLINKVRNSGGKFSRKIRVNRQGQVFIDDLLKGIPCDNPQPMAQNLPYHMGSSRYISMGEINHEPKDCALPFKQSNGVFSRHSVV